MPKRKAVTRMAGHMPRRRNPLRIRPRKSVSSHRAGENEISTNNSQSGTGWSSIRTTFCRARVNDSGGGNKRTHRPAATVHADRPIKMEPTSPFQPGIRREKVCFKL